jgi:hypothetical protein
VLSWQDVSDLGMEVEMLMRMKMRAMKARILQEIVSELQWILLTPPPVK